MKTGSLVFLSHALGSFAHHGAHVCMYLYHAWWQRATQEPADMDTINLQSLPKSPHVFFKRWKNIACFPGCKTVSHCMDPCAAVWLGWQPLECEMLPLATQV